MQIIADLHLHSRYSRAVSQKMDLLEIGSWAKKKGIHLASTSDWTHPIWFRELSAQLKETQAGIYSVDGIDDVSFILSTEISSIYSQGGVTRRVHNLFFAPNLSSVEKFNKKILSMGAKLMSDGRPIVGTSSRNLLEIALSIDENFLLIPAHAWTPWFSLFGSMSGFDSIEECFGDYAKYIYAVETGLSSDPIMNWQIKELDNRSIVSFSDAHSGPKLGREATVFVTNKDSESDSQNLEYTYKDIMDAIKRRSDGKLKIGYTIEFFPEEGKYHWNGHRNCDIRYSPDEVDKKGAVCPVCHKNLTIGVENRVRDLSHKVFHAQDLVFLKNSSGTTFVYDKEKKRVPFVSLVPLLEIFLEVHDHSPTRALRAYDAAIENIGSEFDILMKKSYDEIEKKDSAKLAEGIRKVRERTVSVDPGYDGVFGKVLLFSKHEEKEEVGKQESQLGLF
ncbi:hypothetical protein A3G67_00055 [Candidatus Roizmanbacteria bacterium RIFCSPLOWO2_12_FULL_40_12]|uniref:DNA helicase UvrD n=1 Tax=Candidatus Roizmanbacteria bacterium RIFCSPLOWO2_01_FULL_40_42 TaxID=1802066 RepID=A0A1F7J4A7_9BACT|nr:MAG: hypothetical protein A2779_02220 [Candidatus Roizmanbacteria bacterium RIFCSPHIGHO2_01_FULL_40_98]OGK28600.1 MAG: hypothetical protein A3C31_03135 [Candidatus Roizmanbacteria bacterium RIFCSPHIGHO2_02_FULL_40_53]OGK29890.1 MAG: hypothetical protein A2W49_04355 [Candidatus Roizmanbacteria bacterium RIFCSPHIGHO2_12_41_18]OGK36745.1 MAG: hypothetical protein A3E69_03340 [Candidatus Roizmanbacteria bacterium RIFCSPHIGHO2_12_FULL_40_130]OGK50451.1 MAG: hypothetical protein A3B50_04065 [Candi